MAVSVSVTAEHHLVYNLLLVVVSFTKLLTNLVTDLYIFIKSHQSVYNLLLVSLSDLLSYSLTQSLTCTFLISSLSLQCTASIT